MAVAAGPRWRLRARGPGHCVAATLTCARAAGGGGVRQTAVALFLGERWKAPSCTAEVVVLREDCVAHVRKATGGRGLRGLIWTADCGSMGVRHLFDGGQVSSQGRSCVGMSAKPLFCIGTIWCLEDACRRRRAGGRRMRCWWRRRADAARTWRAFGNVHPAAIVGGILMRRCIRDLEMPRGGSGIGELCGAGIPLQAVPNRAASASSMGLLLLHLHRPKSTTSHCAPWLRLMCPRRCNTQSVIARSSQHHSLSSQHCSTHTRCTLDAHHP